MPQTDKRHRHQLPPPAEPLFAKIGIIDGPVQKVWPDQLTGRAILSTSMTLVQYEDLVSVYSRTRAPKACEYLLFFPSIAEAFLSFNGATTVRTWMYGDFICF